MALLEAPADHTPIQSGDLTVCRECGGEWPCVAMYYKGKFEQLGNALTRIRDLGRATGPEIDALFAAGRLVITHASAIAYDALGGGELGPDIEVPGSPTIDRLRAELDQARAERDAANAQCAKAVREREEQAARWDRQDCERSDAIGGLECRVLELRDERDRARNTAAALEAENAVLRPAVDELTRRRADEARATGPDPWAENEQLRAQLLAVRRDHRSVLHVDTVKAIDAVLARVDPLRAEDGGEPDG